MSVKNFPANPFKDYEYTPPKLTRANHAVSVRVTHSDVFRQNEDLAEIPKSCPTLENAISRGKLFRVYHLFSTIKHNGSVSIYVPDRNEFIKLNQYRHFVRANTTQIDDMNTKEFSEFLFNKEPDLCVWMHKLKTEEVNDLHSSSRMQYITTFIDWCTVYYRSDNTSDLPKEFFHWREMTSIDELEEACDMASEKYEVDTMHSAIPTTLITESLGITDTASQPEKLVVHLSLKGIKLKNGLKRLKYGQLSKGKSVIKLNQAMDLYQTICNMNERVLTKDKEVYGNLCANLKENFQGIFEIIHRAEFQE